MLVFFFHSPSNRGTFFPNNFAPQLPIPKEGKLRKWPAPREKSQRRWLAWSSLSDTEGCAGCRSMTAVPGGPVPSQATPAALCYLEPQLPQMACSISDFSKDFTAKDGPAPSHNLNLTLWLFLDDEPYCTLDLYVRSIHSEPCSPTAPCAHALFTDYTLSFLKF